MTHTYVIDRSGNNPVLTAFTVRAAAKEYAKTEGRNLCTVADARRLCKLLHGVDLVTAVNRGLV